MNENIQVAIQVINDNIFKQNTYIVSKNGKCLIIDPGFSEHAVINHIKFNNLKPVGILLTHFHFDHVANVDHFCKKYHISAYIHQNDYEMVTTDTLAEYVGLPNNVWVSAKHLETFTGGVMKIDEFEFEAINLKGHSEGSTIFVFGNLIFTGDVLFSDSVGRVDLPGSNPDDMLLTINWIKSNLLHSDFIYPGHGQSMHFSDIILKNRMLK